jgi:phytoene dehydrogenase-like protein
LYATTAGHHVVVLDRTDRLGGRGTSQSIDGIPFGYGPHLLDRKGPLAQVTKKVSRLKMALASPRLDRLFVTGVGALRPRNNVKKAAQLRRELKHHLPQSEAVKGANLLASMGHYQPSPSRLKALTSSKLSLVGEGWAGIVGRMAAALDEVGVLIEPNCTVTAVQGGEVSLDDGRSFESDVIILACGANTARKLLNDVRPDLLDSIKPVKASTLDLLLDSKPMGTKHGVMDANEGGILLELSNIQSRFKVQGSLLSAALFAREGESHEAREERLLAFVDQHATGWQHHIVHERRQRNITVQTQGEKPPFDALKEDGILLAGEWVKSEAMLSDAAAETGRKAGQNISSALS